MKMMRSRKAQGISLRVIVIAAIALVVLIVLIVIFSSRVRMFGKGMSTCTTPNHCVAEAGLCLEGEAAIPMSNCDADGKAPPDIEGEGYCCQPVI